jgi:hypothetical protein
VPQAARVSRPRGSRLSGSGDLTSQVPPRVTAPRPPAGSPPCGRGR